MAILKWIGITLATLILLVVLLIAFMDWNWVKDYAARQISETTGRTLTIEHLDVDWSLAPRIRLTGIRFANAPWSRDPYMADIPELAFRISLPKLLIGRVVLPELSLIDPRIVLETSSTGEPNWEFQRQAQQQPKDTGGTWLPTLETLLIKDGRLTYRDPPKDTEINATLAATEGQGNEATRVEANGRLQGEPLQLRLTGGSLLTLPQAGVPYPLKAQLDVAGATARAEGTLQQPLQLKGVDLNLAVQGADLEGSSLLAQNLPELPPYHIQAKLSRQDTAWTVQDLNIQLGDSDLRGTVTLDTTGKERPLVILNAQLASNTLNLVQLTELQSKTAEDQPKGKPAAGQETAAKDSRDKPSGADSQPTAKAPEADRTIDLTPLQLVDAEVALKVDKLIAPPPPLALNNVLLKLTLKEGHLRIDPLSVAVEGGGSIGLQLALDTAKPPVQGSAQINLTQVDPSKVMGGSQSDSAASGTLNGQIKVSLAEQAQAGPLTVNSLVSRIRLEDSLVRYQAPNTNTDVTVTLGTVASGDSAGAIKINGQGQYRGQPVALILNADPIASFGAEDKPYGLSGQLETKDAQGTPSVYQFGTRIAHQGNAWKLPGFQVKFGETDVSGDVTVATGGERPLITAELVSQKLDLRPFTSKSKPSGNEPAAAEPAATRQQDEPATTEPLNLAPLRWVDAKIAYQAKEVIAPELPLENFSLQLELNDGRLSMEPLRTALKGGGDLVSRLRLDATEQPFNGTLTTEFQKLDLDTLAKALNQDAGQQPLGILSGELNLAFTGAKGGERDKDALPYLDRLAVRPSRLSYTNAAQKLDVDGTVSTENLATGKIHLDSQGRYRNQPFKLKFTGDPVLALRDREKPYGVDLAAEVLQTEARIQGKIVPARALDTLDVGLSLKGPDPQLLYPLLGLALPSLPPYQIKGQLFHQGTVWKLNDFDGRVGDSDLHGDIQVDTKDKKPFLVASLKSNKVDLDDLGGLIGAPPKTGPGETASKEQQQKAAEQKESPTVLPHEPINLEKVHAMDASVNFQGKHIKTDLPMDDITIKFELKDGRMTFKPLNFGVAGGDIRSNIELDANGSPIKGNIEGEFRRIDLKKLLKSVEAGKESMGIIGGRAKLWVQGNSFGEFMANSDGGLYLLMTGGQLDNLLVELGGLDIAESLMAWFGKDRKGNAIECAYADLHTRTGKMSLDTFVIDTTDTLFTVDGSVDFKGEHLNVTLKPYPKDFSPLVVRGPLHINGTFKAPTVRPDEVTLGRVALAAILGTVATPAAALLPLIETGPGGDSVRCKGLVQGVKQAESQ